MNFDTWAPNVRDPAEKATEGTRRMDAGEARAFFEREKGLKKGRAEYRKKMPAMLRPDLFGFTEPEPEKPRARNKGE